MGYKQHKNPFSKAISPLKHLVRDPQGKKWIHSHEGTDNKGRPYTVRGQIIQGNKNFGKLPDRVVRNVDTGTRRMPESMGGLKNTERNIAMNYANQIADAYNQGILTSGQFRADDLYRKGPKISIKDRVSSSPWRGKKLEIAGTKKTLNAPEEFNMGVAQGDLVAPENQFTAEQIYDMMVQGGGMVSIVDGNIVAGNPNEVRYDSSGIDQGSGSFVNQIKQGGVEGGRYEKQYYSDERGDNYAIPEGYEMRGQMPSKTLNKYYKWGKEVPSTVRGAERRRVPNPNYEEEIEAWRNFGAGFDDEKSDSPLNSNHDERSDFVRKPDYVYEDEVLGEIQEGEWVPDPNDPTRLMRVNVQPVTITGQRVTPDEENITGGPTNNNPNNLPQEELDRRFTNFCLENPTDPKCKGFNERMGIEIDDTDTQTINREIIEYQDIPQETTTEEIIEETPPERQFSFQKTSGSSGGKIDLKIPKIDFSELISTPAGWFEPKSARGGKGCGCMVNPR
jgi:hypothetical protein